MIPEDFTMREHEKNYAKKVLSTTLEEQILPRMESRTPKHNTLQNMYYECMPELPPIEDINKAVSKMTQPQLIIENCSNTENPLIIIQTTFNGECVRTKAEYYENSDTITKITACIFTVAEQLLKYENSGMRVAPMKNSKLYESKMVKYNAHNLLVASDVLIESFCRNTYEDRYLIRQIIETAIVELSHKHGDEVLLYPFIINELSSEEFLSEVAKTIKRKKK